MVGKDREEERGLASTNPPRSRKNEDGRTKVTPAAGYVAAMETPPRTSESVTA